MTPKQPRVSQAHPEHYSIPVILPEPEHAGEKFGLTPRMSDPPCKNGHMTIKRTIHRLCATIGLQPMAAALEFSVKRLPLAPVHPVRESDEPIAAAFLQALVREEPLPLYYQGGTSPGMLRRFKPHSLYRLIPGGPVYAMGECGARQATRVFRLDRVRLA